MRISIQDIYEINGKSLIITKVETGILRVSDEVIFMPSGIKGKIESIEMLGEERREATPGDSVGLRVKDIEKGDVKRGDVCEHLYNPPSKVKEFTAHAILLYPEELQVGDTLKIYYGTAKKECEVEEIKTRKNAFTEKVRVIRFSALEPMILEEFSKNPQLGRFLIRKGGRLAAAGIVSRIKT